MPDRMITTAKGRAMFGGEERRGSVVPFKTSCQTSRRGLVRIRIDGHKIPITFSANLWEKLEEESHNAE